MNILGLCHERIIDTVGLFPHSQGLPFKKSLKSLAKEYLERDIQIDPNSNSNLNLNSNSNSNSEINGNESMNNDDTIGGHNSIEDASVPLELLFTLIIDHYNHLNHLNYQNQNENQNHIPSINLPNQHLLKYLPSVMTSIQSFLSHVNINSNTNSNSNSNSNDSSTSNISCSCERYTIFHSLLDHNNQFQNHLNHEFHCDFHLCDPYRHLPPWERCSMGYRTDSNISLVHQQFLNDPYIPQNEKDKIMVNIQSHNTVSDSITNVVESLHNSSSSSNSQSHLIWVDMPCNLNSSHPTKINSKSCQGDCLSPEEIENNLNKIISNTQSGDVICVVTQGDLFELKKLMCQKQK